MFNSRFGKLVSAEFSEYKKESVEGKRTFPEKGGTAVFQKKKLLPKQNVVCTAIVAPSTIVN
jgi:hypothetical protein